MDVTNQISALNYVYNTFEEEERRCLKRKLADATLEMERARMSTEDARAATVEKTKECYRLEEEVDRLGEEVVLPALEIMRKVRRDIRVDLKGTSSRDPAVLRTVISASYNMMCDAEKILRDESDDDSDDIFE